MATLAVHMHVVDGTSLVVPNGVLDLARASRLRSVLREAIGLGTAEVVVDLGTVSLLDAGAAGVLARKLPKAQERGVTLRAVGAGGIVLEVLEVLGLAKPLRAYDPRGSAPARPQLPCCEPEQPCAGDRVADAASAAGTGGSHGLPNEAVHALLAEAAPLPGDDPHAQRLRARAIELALPAAYRFANRYRDRGERRDDLLQVAALGLVKAVHGYDPTRGHTFSDYAVPTILGELRRHFRDKGWGLRVPRRLQELSLDARWATETLTQQLGRPPLRDEVAGTLGVPTEVLLSALEAADSYTPRSLSAPVGDGAGELGEMIGGPDPGFDYVDNWESVQAGLGKLPERTRRILALRFYGELSQAEIAAEVGLSQMHVSRLLSQAYATLRAALLEDQPVGE
ncbi:MAG TPA: sigma-70 family RNA polymerase sigma factor [Micromonosporaceae bacterium]|nr:sigma-70 family RNA polymerase sigma factor [Micromonosporaceae bacterium]